MKILVAEDDLVLRRILQLTLSRWGWEVVTACHGQESLDILSQPDAPPVALLDWSMPQLDGIQLCRALRAGGAVHLPYIIMLTGRGGDDSLKEALEAGANDFILKPFENKNLRSCLEHAQEHVRRHAPH
ncbi:MAG: PleD family two-component system response regulator [Gemmataceae bacterium]